MPAALRLAAAQQRARRRAASAARPRATGSGGDAAAPPPPSSASSAADRIAAARRYAASARPAPSAAAPPPDASAGRGKSGAAGGPTPPSASSAAAGGGAGCFLPPLRRNASDLVGRSLIEQAASTAALPDAGVASPEQLQLRRARAPVEVTFVTVDKSYKPAVSTWGVFPRPLDISKEYGGGRNLVPGAPLEADGAAAARLARVRAGVGAYRLAAGLEVSAEAEAACAASTSAGDAALAAGRLEAAAALYREACAAAPAGCAVGGAARLGLALALDSAGDAAGAKALYLELKGHTDAEVRKKATRLLWGMTEASEFLKADSFTYLAGLRESYEVHLSAAVTTDGVMREGGGEGAGGAERAAAAAAVALLALPAGLLALLRGLAAGAHAAGG